MDAHEIYAKIRKLRQGSREDRKAAVRWEMLLSDMGSDVPFQEKLDIIQREMAAWEAQKEEKPEL